MAPAPAKTPANVPMAESLMGLLAQASSNPDVDVNKMLALYEMHEKILAREAKAKFDEALRLLNEHDMRVEKKGAVRDKMGNLIYKHARWEDMDEVIRPLMKQYGLRFSFNTEDLPNGRIKMIGTLHHDGGHSESASIALYPDAGQNRSPNQAMGSTTSYGKRYTAEMLLNIVREDEDDDGAAGGAPQPQRPTQRRPEPRVYDTKAEEEPPEETKSDQPMTTFVARAQDALSRETNGTKWLALLKRILKSVETLDDLAAIKGLKSFKETMDSEKTPTTIKAIIDEELKHTYDRLADVLNQTEAAQDEATEAEGLANGQAKTTEAVAAAAAALAAPKAEDDDTFPADRP